MDSEPPSGSGPVGVDVGAVTVVGLGAWCDFVTKDHTGSGSSGVS